LKIIKKLAGLIGYKLIDKSNAKLERSFEKYLIKVEDFLEPLIKQKKIKKIIQVGANDGRRDDFLYKIFNNNLDAILIEPIENAFEKLKKNYKNFDNVKCLNLAIDISHNQKKKIYTLDLRYEEYYKKKFNEANVEWLNVLSSFSRDHLIKSGIKNKHICSKEVNIITFVDLIKTYNYQDVDLIIIDTEGFDTVLVNNFIDKLNIEPIIIFEWIHAKKMDILNLLEKLKTKNYYVLKIGKDLICYQKKNSVS
jgi:FkbM family methyltransferase